MSEVREASLADVGLVASIAAAGFYDDPVFGWVFPDPSARAALLPTVFDGLARTYLPDRGLVHLVGDACAAFWRRPDYDHHAPPPQVTETVELPYPADVLERFAILGRAMDAVHPRQPHWYLNVISSRPEHQGQGLGGRVLAEVLAVCDAEGTPAYLESSNPRNMSLYRRHGFEPTGEIPLPDGPSLYPMWREPR